MSLCYLCESSPRPEHPNQISLAGVMPLCLMMNNHACIYVPRYIRLWVKQTCHADTSCHLGVKRIPQILEASSGGFVANLALVSL